jgi:uncharacterized membrane protein
MEFAYFVIAIAFNALMTNELAHYDIYILQDPFVFHQDDYGMYIFSMCFLIFLFCLLPSTIGTIYYALRTGKTQGKRKAVATAMTVCHAAALAYPLVMIALLMVFHGGG